MIKLTIMQDSLQFEPIYQFFFWFLVQNTLLYNLLELASLVNILVSQPLWLKRCQCGILMTEKSELHMDIKTLYFQNFSEFFRVIMYLMLNEVVTLCISYHFFLDISSFLNQYHFSPE